MRPPAAWTASVTFCQPADLRRRYGCRASGCSPGLRRHLRRLGDDQPGAGALRVVERRAARPAPRALGAERVIGAISTRLGESTAPMRVGVNRTDRSLIDIGPWGGAGIQTASASQALSRALGSTPTWRRHRLAGLEQHQGRQAADAELGGDLGIGIDVELHEVDLAGVFLGDLRQRRSQRVARSAPLGMEVDQHGPLRTQHVGGEAEVGDRPDAGVSDMAKVS